MKKCGRRFISWPSFMSAKPVQLFHDSSLSCIFAILSSEQTLCNIASGILFPFPSLQLSPCVQSCWDGRGKRLAHRFCWHSRGSNLTMPGSLAQDRKHSVDCLPVRMSLLSHNFSPVWSVTQGPAPDSRAQQRGL